MISVCLSKIYTYWWENVCNSLLDHVFESNPPPKKKTIDDLHVSLFSVNVLGAQWSENFFGSESFKKRSQYSLLRHLKIFFPVNSKKELGSPHLVPWLVYKIRKSTYYTCIKKLYTFLLNNISLYQQRWSNKLKNNSLKCGFFYTILRFNELDIGIGSLFY